MRVLILGPVVNETTSGGVAVFDEGLLHGFKENGDEISIISMTKSSKIENIVVGKNKNTILSFFMAFSKIAKQIKKYKPDLVISSLQYSIGIRKYKRAWKKAVYVQILHGTPSPINGRLKAYLVNFVARYSKKHFDKLVTVSHLSWAINQKINRVTCDYIINTGCALSLPDRSAFTKNRQYDFCYVGRLFRDKNIDLIIDALIKLHYDDPSLKVCIAGYGEMEDLFIAGRYKLDFIDFLGKLPHEKVAEVYQNSKFFISLCSLEACGLAFSEAVINGCNAISSLSSGQTPLFDGYSFYHSVSNLNVDVLYESLKRIYKNYQIIDYEDAKSISSIFSYSNIANQYKNIAEKNKKL